MPYSSAYSESASSRAPPFGSSASAARYSTGRYSRTKRSHAVGSPAAHRLARSRSAASGRVHVESGRMTSTSILPQPLPPRRRRISTRSAPSPCACGRRPHSSRSATRAAPLPVPAVRARFADRRPPRCTNRRPSTRAAARSGPGSCRDPPFPGTRDLRGSARCRSGRAAA